VRLLHSVAYAALAFALVSGASAACGGAADGPPPQGELQEILNQTSDFQRAFLQDGEVSFEEYERSVFGTVQCLMDHGIRILSGPKLVAGGTHFEFSFGGAQNDADHDAQLGVYDGCYREHQDAVDYVWAGQNRPDQKTLDDARAALAECLRAAGVPLPDEPSTIDFQTAQRADPPAFDACARPVQEQFRLPGFGG